MLRCFVRLQATEFSPTVYLKRCVKEFSKMVSLHSTACKYFVECSMSSQYRSFPPISLPELIYYPQAVKHGVRSKKATR